MTPDQPSAEEREEADETLRWTKAERAVENGECAAQLEIADQELRRSMIRNVAAAILAAEVAAYRRAARAVCGGCASDESRDVLDVRGENYRHRHSICSAAPIHALIPPAGPAQE